MISAETGSGNLYGGTDPRSFYKINKKDILDSSETNILINGGSTIDTTTNIQNNQIYFNINLRSNPDQFSNSNNNTLSIINPTTNINRFTIDTSQNVTYNFKQDYITNGTITKINNNQLILIKEKLINNIVNRPFGKFKIVGERISNFPMLIQLNVSGLEDKIIKIAGTDSVNYKIIINLLDSSDTTINSYCILDELMSKFNNNYYTNINYNIPIDFNILTKTDIDLKIQIIHELTSLNININDYMITMTQFNNFAITSNSSIFSNVDIFPTVLFGANNTETSYTLINPI